MSTAPQTPPAQQEPQEIAALVDTLICKPCQLQIRDEIAQGGQGCEVFFIARLNSELQIEEVEAHAYGNATSVPALLQYTRPGDVVLHNHPSGDLTPSSADIDISSQLGERGVGSYIINNTCTQVRIVVKAHKAPGMQPLDVESLAGWLRKGGRLAKGLEPYEERPQQIQMLMAVAEAFNHDGVAVIEAGTGTGKSLAYLLPSIQWALQNEEKVIVSTGTINLQEQLLEKDLPLIAKAAGLQFEAALLKGRGNYLCRRKAAYLRQNPDFLDSPEKTQQLEEIQGWISTTREGSREDLAFTPDPDVWERVMSEPDNCLRVRCPFYQDCFYYNARRRAARAQVLVVNHHLLMSDLAVRSESNNYTSAAVLPAFHRIVLDEAQHLEDVATDHFGAYVSRSRILYNMRRFMNRRTGRGLLFFMASKIHEGLYDLPPAQRDEMLLKLGRELPQRHHDLHATVEGATERIALAVEERNPSPLDQSMEIKLRIKDDQLETAFWRDEIEQPLREIITTARGYLDELLKINQTLRPYLEDATPEGATPILEWRSQIERLEYGIEQLIRFLGEAQGQCRWIQYKRRTGGRPPELAFCLAPLEIAADLRERMLRRFRTVVMTSATLAVGRSFEYFLTQIGASQPELLELTGSAAQQAMQDDRRAPGGAKLSEALGNQEEHVRPLTTLLLDTPFDYENQVYVGVPSDLPEPTEAAYEAALEPFLHRTLNISRGRAFVLFTAYSLLQRMFNRLSPLLESQGLPCLRQGESSRRVLTESFRQRIGSVLFATSSFWEGVDVRGEALSCLVLTRLPFKVPGEPLAQARIEALRERGQDPFMRMVVPQAVIKFRQGFGRLIRSRTDRGAVLICDRRIMTRHYGRQFLLSLPTTQVHNVPASQVHAQLLDFFAKEKEAASGGQSPS